MILSNSHDKTLSTKSGGGFGSISILRFKILSNPQSLVVAHRNGPFLEWGLSVEKTAPLEIPTGDPHM